MWCTGLIFSEPRAKVKGILRPNCCCLPSVILQAIFFRVTLCKRSLCHGAVSACLSGCLPHYMFVYCTATIGRKSRFFSYAMHSTSPVWEPPSDYCHNIWYGKLEWCEYPTVKVRRHAVKQKVRAA